MLRRSLATAGFLALIPALTVAQDQSRSILVLDASGSMWGQIDGVTKIEIAQGVVGDLLGSLPETQSLGLTAYGHRTKGDCTDIETLVMPGAAGRDAIASAVNGLTPRGKTPMTDAVVQAAEALKYTEEKATVILVSDGIETCNPDPCAAAAALEQAGVDITVHVVGFDVSDAEARRQMQCIADETGGQFLSAADASELGTALEEVVQAPAAVSTTLIATAGDGGAQIEEPLIWEVRQGDTAVVDFERAANLTLDLAPGAYVASVLRPEDEASAEESFDVAADAQIVTLVLPSVLPAASVEGPESAVAGATVDVSWEGPDAKNDYVSIAKPDDSRYENYFYTRTGQTGGLLMPSQPGEYELRYVLSEGATVLATQPITVTEVEASVEADTTVPAGATIPVTWEGPDYKNDYISVAKPDDDRYENYVYTRTGTPGDLLMPSEPGTYEVRYVMSQDATVLATQTIEVVPVSASIDAPVTATAGAELTLSWEGPDYKNDYIAISRPDDPKYEAYTHTREGGTLDLTMPAEPGTYELRYVMSQDATVLAAQPIEVVTVGASIDAPDSAAAGSELTLSWEGPDYKNDYIAVSRPDDPKYETYTYTREGATLDVTMPADPGTYELRYVMSQDATILATKTIEVTDVGATLIAPDSAPAGSGILVEWDGPGYEPDYVTVSRAEDPKYEHYTYTREGSPLLLRMPQQPGTYELRYVAASEGTRILTRQSIEVTEIEATLDAPDAVEAGSVLGVHWEGPDHKGDYIALAEEGAAANEYRVYKYTAEDSPLVLKMPEGPGKYELRYVTSGSERIISRKPIELTYTPE